MIAEIRAELKERGEYRMGRRGTFWSRFALTRWQWGVQLCKFSRDGESGKLSLHLFCLWVTLWISSTPPVGDMMDRWGVYFFENSLNLCWGHRRAHFYMPWMYDHCRTEIMLADGRFVPYERYPRRKQPKGGLYVEPEPVGRYRQDFDYRYVLKSGEVQERTAAVTVERRSWCWRTWPFRWLRWPSTTRTSIEVEFSDEVGERSGSWKGGTVGCGYDLLPGETPEACLRRMESERKF